MTVVKKIFFIYLEVKKFKITTVNFDIIFPIFRYPDIPISTPRSNIKCFIR